MIFSNFYVKNQSSLLWKISVSIKTKDIWPNGGLCHLKNLLLKLCQHTFAIEYNRKTPKTFSQLFFFLSSLECKKHGWYEKESPLVESQTINPS